MELGKEPISPDEIRRNFTLPYMKFWNKYFPNLTKEEQGALYEKYIHMVGEPELYEQTPNVIHFLNEIGYKLFIVSSDPISKLLPEVEKSGFTNLLTKIIGGVHEKNAALTSLVENFDLNKSSTFYVGDTSGDIEAGKQAMVKTIGISWGFQHKKILSAAKPDFLIDELIEIKTIVNL